MSRRFSLCSYGVSLLLASALFSAACIEAKPPPAVTPMVEIRDNLVFRFGDEKYLCYTDDVEESARIMCDDPEGRLPNMAADDQKVFPEVTVELQPFAIDTHEVTNAQYRYCVKVGGCSKPVYTNIPPLLGGEEVADYYNSGFYADYPVVNVLFEMAQQYCEFVGKRLPTEYEWERVAGGPAANRAEKRLYPFAAATDDIGACKNVSEPPAIAYCEPITTPQIVRSSSHDRVVEADGIIYDLGGNVREWVLDVWQEGITCANLDCEAEPSRMPVEVDDGCFRLCGREPVCERFEESLVCGVEDGESICAPAPTSTSDRAIRGGSFKMTVGQTCRIRSANRSQYRSRSDNDLGFRCAVSLESD